jgi:hypothetical protein
VQHPQARTMLHSLKNVMRPGGHDPCWPTLRSACAPHFMNWPRLMLVHLVPSPEQIPPLDPLRSRSLPANDLFVHGRQDKVVQHVLHPGQKSETLLGFPSHAICKRRVKKRTAAASARPMILPTGHTTRPLVPVEHWMSPSFMRMIVLFMPLFARALALVGS